MKEKRKMKKGNIVIIFFIIIIIPALLFVFINNNKDVEYAVDRLTGSWIRSDGPYTIKISKVVEGGKMKAEYFNPGPIHVGRSSWQMDDGKLQVMVELSDKNYPGSQYKLTFNEKNNVLHGTYYQAVAKETYEVGFYKKE